jgi:hypothetical protein
VATVVYFAYPNLSPTPAAGVQRSVDGVAVALPKVFSGVKVKREVSVLGEAGSLF